MARRPLCLIVNPSAGRGRAARLLPAVERGAAGARARLPGRAHALARARPRAGARRARRRRGGRGDGRRRAARRRRRRAARAPTACSACCPAGAATTSRASSASAPTPRPPATCSPPAASGRSTSPTPAARPTWGSPRRASTPTCRTSRTPRASRSARGSTSTRRCARCAAGATRTGRSWSTARRSRSPGTPSPWPTRACSAAACTSCPDASLDDGLLDVVLTRACPKRRYLASLPKVFKGTHVDSEDLTFLRARGGRVPRRPPVRRLRRRGPDRGPPRHHQGRAARAEGARPVTLLGPKVAAAKAVGTARARRRAAAAGRRCRARSSRAWSRTRSGCWRSGCAHGSAVISATNGKTTTAAMTAVDPRAHRRDARPQPRRARTWPAASPPRWRPPRAAAGAR